MCDLSLIHVNNSAIEIIDIFTFKCTKCDTQFNPEDVDKLCPKCKAILFEDMKKGVFKTLLIDSFTALNIPKTSIETFMNKGSKISDMGICTEMSVIIDLNFQVKFGGQYKSFNIKDTLKNIADNNFR